MGFRGRIQLVPTVAAAVLAACGGDGGTPIPDAAPFLAADAPPVDADFGPELQVEYCDPDHGPFAGGTKVLLRGRGFADGMVVKIGGRQVEPTDIQIVDQRRAILITPPGDPGPQTVSVDHAGLHAEGAGAYTYQQVYVDPPAGSIAGGTFVRVRGFGTAFAAGDSVTFDGQPLAQLAAVSQTELTGITPPGVAGSADVVVSGAAGTIDAPGAYSYISTADPFAGGLGGGPITDTLNVTVIDNNTNNGLGGAFVTVGNPISPSSLHATTDGFGHVSFAMQGLRGPVSVSASKPGYEVTSFIRFDARDVTIFLVPQPIKVPPSGGPFPPGRLSGTVRGEIVFGGPTGVGVPTWDLVPAPRTPSEVKRAYVFTTVSGPFSGAPAQSQGGIIDWQPDGSLSWPFEIPARPSALAVVAVAGLWDPDVDPDGDGPLPAGVFTPFAMGVARNLLVGPGETLDNVSIIVDIPLDAALRVELVDPPALDPPRAAGPTEYTVSAVVDLGGEGVIRLPGNSRTWKDGSDTVVIDHMPSLEHAIGDASFTIVAGAFTSGYNPRSVRVERGVDDLSVPVPIADFLAIPRAEDPTAHGLANEMHVRWSASGGHGPVTFSFHQLLLSADATPIWRFYARGGMRDLPLWDLVTTAGMPPVPAHQDIAWYVYEARLPGGDFDMFTYRMVNLNLWSAFATDAWAVQFPENP